MADLRRTAPPEHLDEAALCELPDGLYSVCTYWPSEGWSDEAGQTVEVLWWVPLSEVLPLLGVSS